MRFDQARPFLTLGVVLLAWLIVPTVIKRFSRLAFYELQAPVDVTASYARELQDFWSQRTRTNPELVAAARDLARLNASYELRIREDARLRAEITRLEGLLRLPRPANSLEPARVARRDFNVWWQRLVIRKGSNHGLLVGSPVIYVGGLVGRVVEVHSTTSVVELISSPGLRLAAVFEGDDRPVSFQGGVNAPLQNAEALLEFVPLDLFATPSSPRRLVTSGLGGVYPPGFVLGDVYQLEPSTDGLFKTGRVRLDPRLGRLNEVTVLVPLDPAFAAGAATSANAPVMSRAFRQVLVLLACTGGLVALVGQLNHVLSPLALTLAVPGLLITYSALRLPLRTGLALACLTGLWIDAAAPVVFGRHAVLLGLAFCVLHNLRTRLPREETLVAVVAALFVNLALFVVAAMLDLGALPDPAAGGLRLLADLFVSQLFTALIGPWFLAFQTRALVLTGARPEMVVSRFA